MADVSGQSPSRRQLKWEDKMNSYRRLAVVMFVLFSVAAAVRWGWGKWSRLSRPFFARNKLRTSGSDLRGRPQAPPAIPALESALGFHRWRALSSAQVH